MSKSSQTVSFRHPNNEEWFKFSGIENEIIEDTFDDDYAINSTQHIRYKKYNTEKKDNDINLRKRVSCPIGLFQLIPSNPESQLTSWPKNLFHTIIVFIPTFSIIQKRLTKWFWTSWYMFIHLLPSSLKIKERWIRWLNGMWYLLTSIIPIRSRENLKVNDSLDIIRQTGDICLYYNLVKMNDHHKTVSDFVEEAIQGVLKAGNMQNKQNEARVLAEQLENVKIYIDNTKGCFNIQPEIGNVLVTIYTRDSFWYRLINNVLRHFENITIEQLKIIGPFCYLLQNYLKYQEKILHCTVVYRGLNLTDKERRNLMQPNIGGIPSMTFTSFTSTSTNRDLAEIYGNTLCIIDLDRHQVDNPMLPKIRCGVDISEMSNFPEEEEILIRPNRIFDFIKYDYDEMKQKHLIYLRGSMRNW